jgi:hypothetical protein
VIVVEHRRFLRTQLVIVARPITAAPAPPAAPATRPPWIDVLIRHGLLDRDTAIAKKLYRSDPISLLRSIYDPTEARDKGFVYYDIAWGNDTDDVVADLAVLADRPQSFALIAETRDRIDFEVRAPDAVRVGVELDGDLELLAAAMNDWLVKLAAERRIWAWDTGTDQVAFLGRSAREIEEMANAGLPVDRIKLAGARSEDASGADWSDV